MRALFTEARRFDTRPIFHRQWLWWEHEPATHLVCLRVCVCVFLSLFFCSRSLTPGPLVCLLFCLIFARFFQIVDVMVTCCCCVLMRGNPEEAHSGGEEGYYERFPETEVRCGSEFCCEFCVSVGGDCKCFTVEKNERMEIFLCCPFSKVVDIVNEFYRSINQPNQPIKTKTMDQSTGGFVKVQLLSLVLSRVA